MPPRLLDNPTLNGQNIIITGSNSGIGLATARQLLLCRASTIILAVRDIQKGESARSTLLSDSKVQSCNPTANVSVMKLDLDDYGSVCGFAAAAKATLPSLHLLILNAGVGNALYEQSVSGHERTLQVNYLSNVLLMLTLLPLLRETATADGALRHTRITWAGSRAHTYTRLHKSGPTLNPDETILGHFDAPENFAPFWTYADTKLLAALFLYELGERLSVQDGVVVNMFCPGLVDTRITDPLPWYLRIPLNAVKALCAKSVEQAGWVALNAAVVVGTVSHGQFLGDMSLTE